MKQKFSAIVLDIDGTLLNSQGRISDKNLNALKECAKKGILPYIATARPPRLVFRDSEATKDADFIKERGAFYNGAMAIDIPLNYTNHWQIPAETVKSVIHYLIDKIPDLYIVIQRKDQSHSFRLPYTDLLLQGWGITQADVVPFSEASESECSKIVAWHEKMKMTDIHHEITELYKGKINAFITDSASWIQLISSEANKETAIMDLLSLRNISPDEVIVFGDDIPDVGMLRAFGHSVAMGNSSDEVKSVAKYVTLSNDEGGIAYALEKYFGIVQ
jgi:Cof subfamily protein (haloacid dehalogenase superfamily)